MIHCGPSPRGGEYLSSTVSRACDDGSSPRVWGILLHLQMEIFRRRFIPTGWGIQIELHRAEMHFRSIPKGVGNTRSAPARRVGNTWVSTSALSTGAVHPHGGGEYDALGTDHPPFAGSSSRGWGIQLLLLNGTVIRRFIPTGVGNTITPRQWSNGLPVHPHGCGEYAAALFYRSSFAGSSPRVWGIRGFSQVNVLLQRFIPTGVGNTFMFHPGMTIRTVHPHGCGEYGPSLNRRRPLIGSSPRVWGIRRRSS